MGAFRYCINRKCNDGDCRALSRPTPQEDLIEGQKCPDCDTEQPRIYSTEEWIVEAFDEIEALKKELTKVRNRGFTKLDKRIQRLVKQNRSLKKEITELKIKLEKEYVI